MSGIELDNIQISYSGNGKIIDIPKLVIEKGDIVGFFGPNHVGKSTLLRFISQIHNGLNITKGSKITYSGIEYCKKRTQPLILYIPQDFNSSIFPWFSVKKNFRIILKALKFNDKEIDKKLSDFCSEFGYDSENALLEEYGFFKKDTSGKKVLKGSTELSGGQKQILSVLRTIVAKPSIITMDEPFSALDIFKGTRFRKKVFDYLRSNQITTLLVAHELEEIISLTDKLYIFNYNENAKVIVGAEISNVKEDEVEAVATSIKQKYNLSHL